MTGSSMTARFDHNRTEERPRVSPLGVRMAPDVINEKLMRDGEPEHAAPDWMRITATEVRAAQRGKNCGRPRTAIDLMPVSRDSLEEKKPRGTRSIPVCYVNGDMVIRASSLLELSVFLGLNLKSIERVYKTGGCLPDGGRVVAA